MRTAPWWPTDPWTPVAFPEASLSLIPTPAAGEQWGRAGGRNITYAVTNLAGFSALSWGIVNGTTPGAAFDNNLDGLDFELGSAPRPGESMSFNGAGSNLTGGIAQWTGEAQIELVVPTTSRPVLNTRFTLTVTDAGAPVLLAFVDGEVDPGIDVLPTNGTFTVNLLFEAFYPVAIGGDDTWRPLLDLFDLLPTGIAADGFAHTSVNTGFYFVAAGGGALSLEDHDANISGKVDMIKDDTAFLRIDAINRLILLANDLVMLKNQVLLLPTDIQIPSDLATRDDVSDASQQLTETLLILFGLFPCPPEAGPLCDTAIFVQDLATQASVDMVKNELPSIQDKLDDILTAQGSASDGEVHVQAIEVSDQSSVEYRRWLLLTTQRGQLVDAELTRLLAIQASTWGPAFTEDLTFLADPVPMAPGMLDVTIPVAPGGQPSACLSVRPPVHRRRVHILWEHTGRYGPDRYPCQSSWE